MVMGKIKNGNQLVYKAVVIANVRIKDNSHNQKLHLRGLYQGKGHLLLPGAGEVCSCI